MVRTEIDVGRRLVIHMVSGELTLNAGLVEALKMYGQPGYEPDFGVVWDLRDGEMMITFQDIANLDSRISEHVNENRIGGRTAWVIGSSFEESMVKLLYSENKWSAELQTFTTLDAAIRWATAILCGLCDDGSM